ncbi:MAG: M24 family metallopeptidase, partial [Candidatus Gastranaerophilales bacterium]|nr:M24 family metallopeptidase [Candidatus Gastranaerophilales bacterium]
DMVSGAIEDVANREKLGIVRQYGGHGVGRSMHEEPFVFNYRTGSTIILKSGMTIAIEPMLNLGGDEVEVLEDKWTVQTVDKQPSAHFEHSILVTDDEPLILTTLL